jgi:hypothetical protein
MKFNTTLVNEKDIKVLGSSRAVESKLIPIKAAYTPE